MDTQEDVSPPVLEPPGLGDYVSPEAMYAAGAAEPEDPIAPPPPTPEVISDAAGSNPESPPPPSADEVPGSVSTVGDMEVLSNGTSTSSSSAPVLDSQGFLWPVPVCDESSVLPTSVSVSVSFPESVIESAPVSTLASVPGVPVESPGMPSEVPVSTTSWADIVDHVSVPEDISVPVQLPEKPPVVSSAKPPLPPRPSGRVGRTRPAPIVDATVPTRKPTQPSRVPAVQSQKSVC